MRSFQLSLLFMMLLVTACSHSNQMESKQVDSQQLIEDLRVISSVEMEGRRTGTEGNKKAREYIRKRFEEAGAEKYEGSYTHEFTITNRRGDTITGINIIGRIQGEIDSIIVISAHYDHLGMKDSVIFDGADDNASGTAALISYIDYFNRVQPHHTLLFVSFDAEEMGLQGARAFVKDTARLEKVVLNVNLDMIGYNTKDELYASGTYYHPELKPILEEIDTGSIKLLFGHDRPELGKQDWTTASDHGAFHAEGKKYIYFGVEDHKHYHKETDEFANIPQEFFKQATKLILNAIRAFDKQL